MAYLGEDIPKLGFGMMRLPKQGGQIDLELTKQMTDRFLEEGFTYFDTAYVYEGSEEAVRKALVERHPRENYQLATKLASWVGCEKKEDAEKQLETSLQRTGAGYFDYYLLHNLGGTRTRLCDELGLWDLVQEKKKTGLVRHIGFSFHAMPDELEAILKDHPEMEFVQLQINYADWDNPVIRSRECYETARKYNRPVIIMEPVKGGMLATPPEAVREVFRRSGSDASCASWAIRYAADLEGVITVLSGMSAPEQLEDNLSFMKDFRGLTGPERETLKKAQEELMKIPLIPCTACEYCAKVCPGEIGISGTFQVMNMYTLYGDRERAAHELIWKVDKCGRKRAEECIQCGACEEACPQHIAIREELQRTVKALC